MNLVYLLLGGNLGNTVKLIEKARDLLKIEIGKEYQVSSYYESEPWGFSHKNNFINRVVSYKTNKTPQEVLFSILEIERILGRKRNKIQYEARSIDIDILFYNDMVINSKLLILPHPRLHLRKFTLEPLFEINTELIHPVFNKTIKVLLEECTDLSIVSRLEKKD